MAVSRYNVGPPMGIDKTTGAKPKKLARPERLAKNNRDTKYDYRSDSEYKDLLKTLKTHGY